jgi:hypothetical protein
MCVFAAACSGQSLSSPTSPSSVAATSSPSQERSGSSQTQARSGTELPFHGSFTGETHAVFEPPITLVITGTQTGTATHLGRFTATSEARVNTTNNTGTGTFNFTAANGDQLWTATEGAENEFVPPNVSKVTLQARITGGTGRFVGATGTFTINFTDTIDHATSSATEVGSFDGRLNFNK